MTGTGRPGRASPRGGRVKLLGKVVPAQLLTLGQEVHRSHLVALRAAQGRGLAKLAHLPLAVARWLLGEGRQGREDLCRAQAPRAPVARDQALVLVPASARDLLGVQVAQRAAQAPRACGLVARDRLDREQAHFPAALTQRIEPHLPVARRTGERLGAERQREVAAVPVLVLEEAQGGAAGGAPPAGGGAPGLTGKSSRPRHRRPTWRPTPRCPRARSS